MYLRENFSNHSLILKCTLILLQEREFNCCIYCKIIVTRSKTLLYENYSVTSICCRCGSVNVLVVSVVLVDDMLKKVKLNKMSKICTKFTYKVLYSIKNYSSIFVRGC